MKYNVFINQYALHKLGHDLDLIDGAILNYIVEFSHVAEKNINHGHVWFWVSSSKIIKDMPLLKISSERGISKRIDKLVLAGLLVRHPDNQSMKRTFYRMGEKYSKTIASSSQVGTHVPSQSEHTFQVSQNESSDYYNINDNTINDKKVIPRKNESLFDDRKSESYEVELWPMFDDFWNLYDKKTGKEKAQKKWEKLKQSEKEKIMEALPDYVASTPDKNYRKNPETYLNGKHWNDEIIYKAKKIDAVDQILKSNGITLTEAAKMFRG